MEEIKLSKEDATFFTEEISKSEQEVKPTKNFLRAAEKYKKLNSSKNTVDKYYWIIDHPKLTNQYGTQPTIEMTPHMVNPIDCIINVDNSLNTKLKWWIECNVANEDFNPSVEFPDDDSFERCHDLDLDCGGDTAEEAIDNLYNLVIKHYGDYESES